MSTASYRPMLIADYAHDGRALSLEEFVQRHGRAFLLQSGGMAALRASYAFADTDRTLRRNKTKKVGARPDFLVYPVLSRGGATHSLVSVGRAITNDIVVADESVSKVHAEISWRGHELFVRDAGSVNGTWINQQRVRAVDGWRTLRSGDNVELGFVRFNVMTATHFVTMVRHLTPNKS